MTETLGFIFLVAITFRCDYGYITSSRDFCKLWKAKSRLFRYLEWLVTAHMNILLATDLVPRG